jgi:transposase
VGDANLFGEELVPVPKAAASIEGDPRVKAANRKQAVFRPEILDEVIPADHRVRGIWALADKLNLDGFYATIQSRGAQAGRPATDPKILIVLWLYATSENVGSARQLARLCERDDVYRWICGGVEMNHHTLSDFRVAHGERLDDMLTQLLSLFMREGMLTLQRVAQDGMRVRASAGAASFRSKEGLDRCIEAARQRVASTKQMLDQPDDPTRDARREAAKKRAAEERLARVEKALKALPEIQEAKRTVEAREKARASTTDSEARVMKMADGGFRPAFNVQLATDADCRVIVGCDVTNVGNDMGQMPPMIAQIEHRTGKAPVSYLVDGGFAKHEAIDAVTQRGVQVLAPVPATRKADADPHVPKITDSAAVAEWRTRMATPQAKEAYRARAATAETVNADLRVKRGLDRLLVRGIDKVKAITLWSVLAYNMLLHISATVS